MIAKRYYSKIEIKVKKEKGNYLVEEIVSYRNKKPLSVSFKFNDIKNVANELYRLHFVAPMLNGYYAHKFDGLKPHEVRKIADLFNDSMAATIKLEQTKEQLGLEELIAKINKEKETWH